MKKFRWVNLVKGTMINKRITRLKSTKEVLLGVVDFADYIIAKIAINT